MDKFLEVLGAAGGPTTFVGVCLTILFYIRRQESGIRSDINGSLQRLTVEKESQQAEIDDIKDELEAREVTIDTLRRERRESEDREDTQRRRADAAEALLQYTNEKLIRLQTGLKDMEK